MKLRKSLVIALALSSAGCSDSPPAEAIAVIPAAERKSPIEMSATTVDGEKLNIALLRGKPLVMNVWGSWCGPCRAEAPALQQAYEDLKDSAHFVGLAFEDTQAAARSHEEQYGITYPSFLDEGDLLLALNGAVTSRAIPVTLVLDEQGRIAGRYVGQVSAVTLKNLVQDIAG